MFVMLIYCSWLLKLGIGVDKHFDLYKAKAKNGRHFSVGPVGVNATGCVRSLISLFMMKWSEETVKKGCLMMERNSGDGQREGV